MDELVQFCLKELAFDGDLGCDVGRLRDFVDLFYSSRTAQPNVIDDDYHAFVWAIIVRQPSVRVGLLPEGTYAEVYVPTQPRGTKGSVAKQEDVPNSKLTLELVHESEKINIALLSEKYGKRLRVAVDPETCFAAITGSHSRPTKLTPMVYATLQLIARAREKGISVLDIGKKTNYDQKTCFYLVKQLLELGHIVKLRQGGTSQNFCVHKYFFDRNPLWTQIRALESRDEEEAMAIPDAEHPAIEMDDGEEAKDESRQELQFDPIETHHLTSLNILRTRIVKLLRHSDQQTHICMNLAVKIGYKPKSRTERRFFLARLNELISEGTIEKVYMPSRNPFTSQSRTLCVRLVSDRAGNREVGNEVVKAEELDEEEASSGLTLDEENCSPSTLVYHKSIHRQIVERIASFGTSGATLNDICGGLGSFDRRTVELLVTRMEKNPPPLHLADLSIVQVLETHGRERRYRFFSVTAYNDLLQKEGLDGIRVSFSNEELAEAGAFSQLKGADFYSEGKESLVHLSPAYVPFARSQKSTVGNREKEKKGKNEKAFVNPVLPDGTRKRGRPRKDTSASKRPTKRAKHSHTSPTHEVEEQDSELALVEETQVLDSDLTELSDSEEKKHDTQRDGKRSVRARGMVKSGDVQSSVEQSQDDVNVSTLGRDIISETARRDAVDSFMSPLRERPVAANDSSHILGSVNRAEISGLPEGDMKEVPLKPLDESGWSKVIKESKLEKMQREMSTNPSTLPEKEEARTDKRKSLTRSRRENEILSIIEDSGGILSVSGSDVVQAYMTLVEARISSGRSASGLAGTRIDRRTLNTTLESLQESGKIKMMMTSITSNVGTPRQVKIAFLPETSEDQLRDFLVRLGQSSVSSKSTASKFDATASSSPVTSAMNWLHSTGAKDHLADKWPRNEDKLKELFSLDDSVIREAFRLEKQTLSQLYGFLPSKLQRARRLHIYLVGLFAQHVSSKYILSNDYRIIDWEFFYTDLPLGLFCSIVPSLSYRQDIEEALRSGANNMPLTAVPNEWKPAVNVGKAKGRDVILGLLEILWKLKLVDPLETCDVSECTMDIVKESGDRKAFRKLPAGWETTVPSFTPKFWLVRSSAPRYAVNQSDKTLTINGSLPITTHDESILYWDITKEGFADQTVRTHNSGQPVSETVTECLPPRHIVKLLVRQASWNEGYELSWYQRQYLERFVDKTNSRLALRNDDEEEFFISRISGVIGAPETTVREFFSKLFDENSNRLTLLRTRVLEKQVEREKREQAKLTLAQKAAEARRKRETDCDALVAKVHPSPLTFSEGARIKPLKEAFVKGGLQKQLRDWEERISNVLNPTLTTSNAQMLFSGAKRPIASKLPHGKNTGKDHHPQEKSLDSVIALQKDAFTGIPPSRLNAKKRQKRSGASQKDESESKGRQRRSRFQWNNEFDDLAIDASVIIRSRCRSHHRIDYGAISQVFPFVPRNGVRQHLTHLKEIPGTRAYIQRLENSWHELWLLNRGTTALPDPTPSSPTEFDLKVHIEFLRRMIDKSALRVGLIYENEEKGFVLPRSIQTFLRDWEVVEVENSKINLDLTTVLTEETREKQSLEEAHTVEINPVQIQILPEALGVAEAALKMVIGTPNEDYDSEEAANFLKDFPEDVINAASDDLLSRNVLSKLVRDNRRVAGRTLKISEMNQNALGGAVSRDLFQDAKQMEESYSQQDGWHPWPFTATEGDTAALLHLLSAQQVHVKFDTTNALLGRKKLDWNSRKADDDDLEITMLMKLSHLNSYGTNMHEESDRQRRSTDGKAESLMFSAHGTSIRASWGSCRKLRSDGPYDCQGCVEESYKHLMSGQSEERTSHARMLFEYITSSEGQTLEAIQKYSKLQGFKDDARSVLRSLNDLEVPLVYFLGYSTPKIVSVHNIHRWTVQLQVDDENVRLFPRRWLDVRGKKVEEIRDAAVKSVVGLIHLRPGIPQSELLGRLNSTFDRQEAIEVLRYLVARHQVRWTTTTMGLEIGWPDVLGLLTGKEEDSLHWFIDERHRWYQVS